MSFEKRPIPFFSRYEIFPTGEIVEIGTGRIITHLLGSSGIIIVRLKGDNWKWVSPSVARLILTTYKSLESSTKYAHSYVVYADNDKTNVALTNLTWGFKNYIPAFRPGINIREDTFVTIFDHPKYEINALGVVRNKKFGICQGYISKKGYIRINLSDIPNKIIGAGLHRLLALTFLEHPIDTSDLVINHKDGNPGNNKLENLEWVTRSRNNKHAYEIGLRTESTALVAMNLETRQEITFYSIGECARFIGVKPQALHSRIFKTKAWKPYKGYWIKLRNSDKTWPPIGHVVKRNLYEHVPVDVKNIKTEEVLSFNNAWNADRVLGFSKGTTLNRLKGRPDLSYRNYLFKRAGSDSDWPEVFIKIKRPIRSKRPYARPVRVTNVNTNEIFYPSSVGSWCKEKNISHASVLYCMRRERQFREYLFEYL